MQSIMVKLVKLSGLIDTKDVTDWENEFLKNVSAKVEGSDTMMLTGKQVEVLERIYSKHFA